MDISGIGKLLRIGVAVTVTSVVAVACGDSGSGSEANVQPASPSVSTEQRDPLEGRWAQDGVTCAERRAAVLDAGFSPSDWTMVLEEVGELEGVGAELCVSHDTLAFQDGQIVAFSGGVFPAWEGRYEVTDGSIVATDKDALDQFTLRYSLDEDTLTFEVVDLTLLQSTHERDRTIGLVIWTAGLEAAPYARVG